MNKRCLAGHKACLFLLGCFCCRKTEARTQWNYATWCHITGPAVLLRCHSRAANCPVSAGLSHILNFPCWVYCAYFCVITRCHFNDPRSDHITQTVAHHVHQVTAYLSSNHSLLQTSAVPKPSLAQNCAEINFVHGCFYSVVWHKCRENMHKHAKKKRLYSDDKEWGKINNLGFQE